MAIFFWMVVVIVGVALVLLVCGTLTLPDGAVAYGLTVGYSADAVTYTAVADVEDCDIEGDKTDAPDITTNSSTSACRTFTPGLHDPGNFKFKQLYTTANYTAMTALYRAVRSWKVTINDTHTCIFQGFISAMPLVLHMSDPMMMDVTIKISGPITYS